MTTNQPSTIEERLSRLETLFVNVGEKVATHDGNIDVLVANIQELKETVQTLTEETNRNINKLAQEAAQDRQELRNSVNQILNYLRDRNGGSAPPQI